MKDKILNKNAEIERSLITSYKKTIWGKFTSALKEYNLIEDGDKIAICISGGKDSFLLAKLFQELKKHGKNNFELVFLSIDPGYSDYNKTLIQENAKLLNIPLQVISANIFDYVTSLNTGSPCYLCARMRRGTLYSSAKELGCNKIALGHHFDDVIETTLMSMFYNGQFKSMMPKLNSENFENMELIRPMFKIREKDIINWKNKFELHFQNCGCKFVEDCSISPEKNSSKRKETKNLIKELEKNNPVFADNIFRSLYKVNLNTIISYEKDGKEESIIKGFTTTK